MKGKLISFLVGVVFLTLASTAMAATTWYVNGVSGSDSNDCTSAATACKTIGHAISLAASGDTIKVAAATYMENLTIAKSLTVLGAGPSATVINGGGVGRVIVISGATTHVTLSGVDITNGYVGGTGSGINNSGVLTLINSAVIKNIAHNACNTRCGADGAGINNSGTLTINGSILSGNLVKIICLRGPCPAHGGAIYNGGTLTINKSTLQGNHGPLGMPGGAIYTANAMLVVNNSTLSGNSDAIAAANGTVMINNSTIAGSNGYGIVGGEGGSSGTLRISSSTVDGNSSYGVWNQGTGVLSLQNSIVANNTIANCGGAVNSNGYNLSSDNTCNFSSTGDLNNTNLQLGPLQNNGGPTQTMALPSGSPAVDAGNPSGCTDGHGNLLKTDQRGMPRPDKEDSVGCDMGAYERQTD